MKIELTKDIKLYQMEFVGEVDFFDEKSPYIELLHNMETKEDLIEELEYKAMPESAIKNILSRLENLKVLKNGYIENIKDGFPEKEYGKYTLEIFENDTVLPFKNKNKGIKREKAVSRNTADNIKQDKNYIKIVQDKENKDFRINAIENDKVNLEYGGESRLVMKYGDQTWQYTLNHKNFKMKELNFDDLFKGEWDSKYESLMISFSIIKEKDEFIKSFKIKYSDKIELDNYGKLEGKFQDIPIIPKTQYDAKEWFIYLLKDEIEQLNRYISKDELHQLWENTKEKYPKFEKFDLEFDFEMILKEFGKSSKYYWLLQAGIDLYPFITRVVPKNEVIIHEKENIDLEEDLFVKFNMEYPKELIIVDRWIVNLSQFQGLDKIIEVLGNPKVTVITQKVKDKKNNKLIDEIIEKNNIKIIEKVKQEIVHQRYWIFDNENIYQTSESLDFLTIIDNSINIKYVTFKQYENKDLDPKLLSMEIK